MKSTEIQSVPDDPDDLLADDSGEEDNPAGPHDPYEIGDLLDDSDDDDDFTETKVLSLPVHKPDKRLFIRVHPDANLSFRVCLLEQKEDAESEFYIVVKSMREHQALETLLAHRRVFPAVNQYGAPFLWPVPLPVKRNAGGRRAGKTAIAVAEEAKTGWVRVVWSWEINGYVAKTPRKPVLDEPTWAWFEGKTRDDLIRLGFGDNIIDSPEHPVVVALENGSQTR